MSSRWLDVDLLGSGMIDMGLDARGRARFAFNIIVTKEGSSGFDEEIAEVLEDGGITAASIYLTSKAVLPEDGGPFLTVTMSGGLAGVRVHNLTTGPKYFKPSALVMAIGLNTTQTRDLAWQAQGLLTAVKNENVTA